MGGWAKSPPKILRVLDGKRPFRVGDIEVNPFPLSHDAADPVGYALRAGDARIAIATDTGEICESWMQYCEGADLVLLESNYDPAMLEAGPYPIRSSGASWAARATFPTTTRAGPPRA